MKRALVIMGMLVNMSMIAYSQAFLYQQTYGGFVFYTDPAPRNDHGYIKIEPLKEDYYTVGEFNFDCKKDRTQINALFYFSKSNDPLLENLTPGDWVVAPQKSFIKSALNLWCKNK